LQQQDFGLVVAVFEQGGRSRRETNAVAGPERLTGNAEAIAAEEVQRARGRGMDSRQLEGRVWFQLDGPDRDVGVGTAGPGVGGWFRRNRALETAGDLY